MKNRNMGRALYANAVGALFVTMLMAAGTPAESPVADAAMQGETEQVRALLRGGEDVNAAQGDGMTALHWAAETGNNELAQMLLYAGANVGAVTRLADYTALHLASRAGRAAIVETLLTNGSDVDAVTSTGGVTALHFAAMSGNVEVLTTLLAHGADINNVEYTRGQTPLMFAASTGRTAMVQALLAAGADPDVTSTVVDIPARSSEDRAAGQVRRQVLDAFSGGQPDGSIWMPTPSEVQAAVRVANASRVEGVDPGPEQRRDEPGPDPHDALSQSRLFGFGTLTTDGDSLGNQGPDPDAYSSSYTDLVYAQGGLSALHHAVREGQTETALALVEGGADINQVTAGDLTTPILMAAINGHFDLALNLLERGADPNIGSHAGTTPLYAVINTMWAPKARYPQQQAYQQQEATHLDVMESLLEAGADPNVRLTKHLWFMEYTFSQLDVDTRGATPFWRAAYALDLPAMRLLIERGADPSVPTMKAPTRRFVFAPQGSDTDESGLSPVEVGGADVFPIHAATGHAYGTGFAGVSHRHAPDSWLPAVTYLVEELGADVNARDAKGFAPLHWAASRGDNEVINYLVSKGADATVVSREGQTTADMANGPVQRISPFPETIALLEGLGSKNNNACVSCQ
jgi:ankyrin repeat protein